MMVEQPTGNVFPCPSFATFGTMSSKCIRNNCKRKTLVSIFIESKDNFLNGKKSVSTSQVRRMYV